MPRGTITPPRAAPFTKFPNDGESMYCQTCGAEIQPGLNYCNRCGALVNGSMGAPRETLVPVDLTSPVRWISATVGLTFLIGLIAIFIAIYQLSLSGLKGDAVGFISLWSLMTLLVVDLSLIRLLSRVIGVSKERGTLSSVLHRSKELKAPQPQAYMPPAQHYAATAGKAYTDPLPSVTEHTTRTFPPAYREPRASE